MLNIGLTGSIGMGKTTTAILFAAEGVPVHDADAVVHKLYEGPAAELIENMFPNTTLNGKVDRRKLGEYVVGNPTQMKKLEAIVHPLVVKEREKFLIKAEAQKAPMVIFDIPLLFETNMDKECDAVIVVTTNSDEQRKRVLSRPEMSEEKFENILSLQMPDEIKRKKADYIIDTSNGVPDALRQVKEIIKKLSIRNDGKT